MGGNIRIVNNCNMNYTIRKIESPEDFSKMEELWCERNKRMKTAVADQKLEFQKSISVGTSVGAFDKEDNLVGILRYLQFQTLPFAFLYNLHIKKGLLTKYEFANEKNPITYILDYIITECETKKIYTWYYTRALSKGYHKIYQDGTDLFRQSRMCYDTNTNNYRYERYVEEIVPSGTKSKIITHNILLGDKVYKPNLVLFKCCLKNNYRDNGDVLVNESKYY